MATLGLDALNWTRRLLESYEKQLFTIPGDANAVWAPPSQEALERLDFLAGVYWHLRQVVDAETKSTVSYTPGLGQPPDSTMERD